MRRLTSTVIAILLTLTVLSPVAAAGPTVQNVSFTAGPYVFAACDGYDVMEQIDVEMRIVSYFDSSGSWVRDVTHGSSTGVEWRSDTGDQIATYSDAGGTFTAAVGARSWFVYDVDPAPHRGSGRRPDRKDDAELVRCWYAEDNFQRLERANEMAKKKGVAPINIALAYVLNQPFPTFALIGPRQLSETRMSFAGLDVNLTPAEVKWLNLEA